jgi:hypothetical protein
MALPLGKVPTVFEHTGDRRIDAVQGYQQTYDRATINACPFIAPGSRFLEVSGSRDIVFSATVPQTINHLLGRTPIGFIVADASTTSGFPSIRANSRTDTTITLESDDDITAKIWVY